MIPFGPEVITPGRSVRKIRPILVFDDVELGAVRRLFGDSCVPFRPFRSLLSKELNDVELLA